MASWRSDKQLLFPAQFIAIKYFLSDLLNLSFKSLALLSVGFVATT